MISSAAELALSWNEQGLKHMSEGQYPSAIRSFTRSLGEIKKELSNEDGKTACLDSSSSIFLFSFCDAEDFDHSVSEAETEAPTATHKLFIFECPIAVHLNCCPSCFSRPTAMRRNLASLKSFSAALLYNLGLAFHLLAREREDMVRSHSVQRYLQKAAKLYQLAYSMVASSYDEESALQRCDYLMLEKMSVLNNLGLVHDALGSSEEAKLSFQCLLRMAMASCSSTTGMVTTQGQQRVFSWQRHMDLFFRNIQTVIFSSDLKAAEAA
jgi:tetratricopeptide (TPR) repeat protein